MQQPDVRTKKCLYCNVEFPTTNEYFKYINKTKNTLQSKCKQCVKNGRIKPTISENIVQENSTCETVKIALTKEEKRKETRQKYYDKTKERLKTDAEFKERKKKICKKYYEKNKQLYKKKYMENQTFYKEKYLENKDKIKERYLKNRDKIKEQHQEARKYKFKAPVEDKVQHRRNIANKSYHKLKQTDGYSQNKRILSRIYYSKLKEEKANQYNSLQTTTVD